jgi:hypothetical protein
MKKYLALLLFACSFATQGFAQSEKPEPRHFDFTTVLTGIDGKPIQNGDVKPPVPMTLGDVVVGALEMQTADDQHSTGEAKFKLDELARRIYGNKDVVLSVEDLATIKARIGKAYGPLIVGASWRLIDPAQK